MELMYINATRLHDDMFTCRPSILLDLATKEIVNLPLCLRGILPYRSSKPMNNTVIPNYLDCITR